MKHLMIDLETLGTKPGSAIAAIAAVEFDVRSLATGRIFCVFIDISPESQNGLTADRDTVDWWNQQNPDTRRRCLTGTASLNLTLDAFSAFVKARGDDVQVWGNSARFDLGILEAAYQQFNKPVPWNHYNERCVRTIASLLPCVKASIPIEGEKHYPLHDCLHQIKYLHETFNALGLNIQ